MTCARGGDVHPRHFAWRSSFFSRLRRSKFRRSAMSSSKPKRPVISIYDYPEHLNPFNDDDATTNPQPQTQQESKPPPSKESKRKFWTFGRSRKKRSNSFSLKSTWNGLFGKRTETPESTAKRSTITTVSTTYKREARDKPEAPLRLSKDQQEFDEALGTLTRRRKYTLEGSNANYSSHLTVNGDLAKRYDGNPQDTTTSIMSVELTPKAPIRRFGQVSPRPTDKIPALDFDKHPKQNGDIGLHDRSEETPIPPLRRGGNRLSQRSNVNLEEDSANRSGDTNMRDENENVPEDCVFKRFSQDAVRRSNLSINSCISVTSMTSTYGRKKRRAPQPPQRREQLETSPESDGQSTIVENQTDFMESETNKVKATEEGASKTELQITDTIDIVRVTENIDEMAKRSCEKELNEKSSRGHEEDGQIEPCRRSIGDKSTLSEDAKENGACRISRDGMPETREHENSLEHGNFADNLMSSEKRGGEEEVAEKESEEKRSSLVEESVEEDSITRDSVNVEYKRTSQERLEIIEDVDQDSEDVCLRSKGTLSRSDSFSVKEEIEKIEKQIKALESKEQESIEDAYQDSTTSGRLSIQANRRHFFENMVDGPVKLEFKKLPCEQKDIDVVTLTDSPVAAPRDPVTVIELHISEPIKRKPELLDEVNPIPKPRRHSALCLRDHAEAKLSRNETQHPHVNDNSRQSF